jgi:transcriptional regulator with XRE-family HTH domain
MSRDGQLGVNLRHLAGMHDVSQRELAGYLGLSAQGIWNIVHGRSEPRLRTAERMATAFAIPVDLLFADTAECVRGAAAVFEQAPIRQFTAGRAAVEHANRRSGSRHPSPIQDQAHFENGVQATGLRLTP